VLNYFRYVDGRIEHSHELDPALYHERADAIHWVDLEDPSEAEAALLTEVFHFHPLAIEDTLKDVNHPKVDDYDDYIFMTVHGIRFDAPTDQFFTRELDIFLGPNYLVTHHEGPMRSISAARDLCAKNLQKSMPRGADFLLHQILDQLFDHYFPNLDLIEDKIQHLQVEVFENPTATTLDQIFVLRRDIMQMRRLCMPQRELVNRISRSEFKVVSARAAVYFRDIYDNLYRLVDASFSYQDTIQGTLDAYLSSVSNRHNETMKRLTVITAILASLTVISGIYGMNFEHLPELQWRYGYVWALGLMTAVPASLVLWFKRKGWL
jgi:magnesium transporter